MRAAKIIETHAADAESFDSDAQGWSDRLWSLANWNGVKRRDVLPKLLRRYFDDPEIGSALIGRAAERI